MSKGLSKKEINQLGLTTINVNDNWINLPVADAAARTALTGINQGVLVSQKSDDSLWQKTASSWLQIAAQNILQTVTTSITLQWGYTYLINTTSGDITLTMPTAVGSAGKTITIIKIADVNEVIINAASGQPFYAPLFLFDYGSAYTFLSDGARAQTMSSWQFLSNFYIATSTPPSASNDFTEGYAQGSFGLVLTSPNNQVWWCANPGSSGGDAEWLQLALASGVAGITSTATAGATTTLTAASTQIQRCTGSNFQNYKLPNTSTLSAGYSFTIINESTLGSTTVYADDNSTIIEIFPGRSITLYVNSTGNAGASDWSYIYNSINWNPDQLEFVSGQLTIKQNYLASIWRLPLALCAETKSLPEGAPTAILNSMPVTDASTVVLLKAFASSNVTGDDVIINVYVNGSPLGSVTILEGQQFGDESVEVAVSADDIITVDADVPTGAVAIGVKVILFAGVDQAV